jgi:hypothetical protein
MLGNGKRAIAAIVIAATACLSDDAARTFAEVIRRAGIEVD